MAKDFTFFPMVTGMTDNGLATLEQDMEFISLQMVICMRATFQMESVMV